MEASAAKKTEDVIVSKLTVKSMGCDPRKVTAIEDPKARLPLCRILGKANDVRYQEDQKNPGTIHTYFVGTFEGINIETGDVYRSGKLFLPKGISEAVESAIKGAKDSGDNSASVSFAFELRAVKASNPIGYSYEAAALKRPEVHDELDELRKLLLAAGTDESRKTLGAGAQKDRKTA